MLNKVMFKINKRLRKVYFDLEMRNYKNSR